MESKFEIGDLVMLASGEQEMHVIGISPDGQKIKCIWNEEGVRITKDYPIYILEHVYCGDEDGDIFE